MDKYFCWLFVFSPEGKLISRELGQGRGPQEVACQKISAISKLKDGSLLVLGYTLDHYFFGKDYEKTAAFMLTNNNTNNKAESSNTYTTFYPNLEIKDYNDHLFYNIYSESNNFNFIDTPQKYYKNSKTLMQVNRKNGKVEQLLGTLSILFMLNQLVFNV